MTTDARTFHHQALLGRHVQPRADMAQWPEPHVEPYGPLVMCAVWGGAALLCLAFWTAILLTAGKALANLAAVNVGGV